MARRRRTVTKVIDGSAVNMLVHSPRRRLLEAGDHLLNVGRSCSIAASACSSPLDPPRFIMPARQGCRTPTIFRDCRPPTSAAALLGETDEVGALPALQAV